MRLSIWPLRGRWGFLSLVLLYGALIMACLGSLWQDDELSLGRRPLENLLKTAQDFARPSFLDVWWGNTALEYKNDEGRVLRVENRP